MSHISIIEYDKSNRLSMNPMIIIFRERFKRDRPKRDYFLTREHRYL